MASYTNVKSGNLSITGADEIKKALKKLSTNVATNVMVGAIRAGANTVRDEAKRLVPVKSGRLRKSIQTRRAKTRQKHTILFAVAPMTRTIHTLQDANGIKRYNYARVIEEGRKAEFGTSITRPQPFMRPAFEKNGTKAIEETRKYLAERLPLEVEKAKQ